MEAQLMGYRQALRSLEIERARNGWDRLAAGIFWLYIVGSLWFSAIAIYTIMKMPTDPKRPRQRQQTYVLGALAATSFVTLSFNMLNILLESFGSWQASTRPDWTDVTEWLPNIWQWSLETKPFYVFVVDITQHQTGIWWAFAAFSATYIAHVYMSIEGKRLAIPRLWSFFGLAQFLPISFALTLFFIAVARSPKSTRSVRLPWTDRFLPLLGLAICFFLAARLIELSIESKDGPTTDSYIMPLVLLARQTLLFPVVYSDVNLKGQKDGATFSFTSADLCRWLQSISAILLALQLYHLPGTSQLTTLFHGPAVATLGCDLLLTVTISHIWAYGLQHDE